MLTYSNSWGCQLNFRPIFTTLALGLLCGLSGFAQTITGSITGTVTDATGAVVSSAKATAKNTATNVETTAATNQSGVYNLLFLPAGQYTLTVDATGFKKSIVGPFGIEVNQTARLDVQMQVGNVSESVEVKDVAPVLQTESASTGDTISGNTATSVPIKGRNFATLTLLVPGSINPNPNGFNAIGRNTTGGRPYVNGNREQTNNFVLDGQEYQRYD